jgi:hypothetical protein
MQKTRQGKRSSDQNLEVRRIYVPIRITNERPIAYYLEIALRAHGLSEQSS